MCGVLLVVVVVVVVGVAVGARDVVFLINQYTELRSVGNRSTLALAILICRAKIQYK